MNRTTIRSSAPGPLRVSSLRSAIFLLVRTTAFRPSRNYGADEGARPRGSRQAGWLRSRERRQSCRSPRLLPPSMGCLSQPVRPPPSSFTFMVLIEFPELLSTTVSNFCTRGSIPPSRPRNLCSGIRWPRPPNSHSMSASMGSFHVMH